MLVLRGEGLGSRLDDTDPQETGVPPEPLSPQDAESERSARIVRAVLDQAREILGDEERILGFLSRGFARFDGFPSVTERFGPGDGVLDGLPAQFGIPIARAFHFLVKYQLGERHGS